MTLRQFLVGMMSVPFVFAHEGEEVYGVEQHSGFEVFWDTVIAPNLLVSLGVLAVIVFVAFAWWLLKHGK
jgi:hypothetical protein